jgi:group I intron endonuclease
MKIAGIGYIYMITSPIGRIYIGSCLCEKHRWYSYYNLNCKEQTKLYNSLKKYGPRNHTFEIIWAGLVEDMLRYETLIGWGFNVLERDNLNSVLPKLGTTWSCISNETRNRISIAQQGKKASDETKKKMSEMRIGEKSYWYGRKMSDLSRKKMSESKKGKVFPKEFLEMVSNINKIPVIQLDKEDNFIKEWSSAKDAGVGVNISSSGITSCCKNKPKYNTAGGYKWKYK